MVSNPYLQAIKRPFIRGITPFRGLTITMVINHLSTSHGMVLQVEANPPTVDASGGQPQPIYHHPQKKNSFICCCLGGLGYVPGVSWPCRGCWAVFFFPNFNHLVTFQLSLHRKFATEKNIQKTKNQKSAKPHPFT